MRLWETAIGVTVLSLLVPFRFLVETASHTKKYAWGENVFLLLADLISSMELAALTIVVLQPNAFQRPVL